MKVHSYEGDYGDPFYMQTRNDSGSLVDAISKIDEKNLKAIASDLGVNYYHIEKDSAIRDVIGDISSYLDEFSKEGQTGTEGYKDTYYYFCIPLAVLLVYDMIYYKRRMKE